jgi:RNAse (barnase) inhibitor barstar
VSAPGPGMRVVHRPAAQVAADVARSGATVRVVGPAASKRMFLADFARELEFPAWVGRNWDALADALRDLSWLPAGPLVVVWSEPSALLAKEPRGHAIALEVLQLAADESAGSERPLTFLLTDTEPE